MNTDCAAGQLEFSGLGPRRIQAAFDGGRVTFDGGVLLLREVVLRTRILDRFAACLTDRRDPDRIEHTVTELISQRILAITCGYEDLNDHDILRDDALLAAAAGSECAAGASLLRSAIGLDADGRTRRLRDVATIAGTVEPHQAAAENLLADIAGITASVNAIYSICQDAGAVAEALMATGAHSPACNLAPGEVLYVMADGCMVWIGDGWHEVKFAVIFPDLANVEVSKDRREITARTVVATTGDRGDLGAMAWAAVERWLPKDVDGAQKPKDRIVFISDGSPWLTNMVDEHLPGAMVLLDAGASTTNDCRWRAASKGCCWNSHGRWARRDLPSPVDRLWATCTATSTICQYAWTIARPGPRTCSSAAAPKKVRPITWSSNE